MFSDFLENLPLFTERGIRAGGSLMQNVPPSIDIARRLTSVAGITFHRYTFSRQNTIFIFKAKTFY